MPELNFSALSKWILRMSEIPDVRDTDEKFLAALIQNNLVQTTQFQS